MNPDSPSPTGPSQASSVAPPAVVLVRPQHDGNLGAVARVMANFGLGPLLLVDPAADPGSDEARARAVSAAGLLDDAATFGDLASAAAPFGRIVATSSLRGRREAGTVLPVTGLAGALAADPPGTPTALVFGGERSGLTDAELALAAPLVTIPTSGTLPTLNLAQAVLLVAWELRRGDPGKRTAAGPAPDVDTGSDSLPADQAALEGLFAHGRPLLDRIGFARNRTIEPVLLDLRRLAARAGLTRREVAILRGILRRAGHALDRPRESAAGGARGGRRHGTRPDSGPGSGPGIG